MTWRELCATALVLAYNLTIIGGCVFLVWNGWSAWTFLIAGFAVAGLRTGKAAEK